MDEPNATQNPGAAGADGSNPDAGAASPGYTIEISVAGDGSVTVGTESAAEENAEESGTDGGDAGGDADEGAARPVKDIKEAMVLALEIYKNNGQMPAPDDSDSQFAQGFKGGDA